VCIPEHDERARTGGWSVTSSALVVRLALVAFAVAGVACKKEADPAKARSSDQRNGGDTSSLSGAETSGDGSNRNAKLPAMPRRLPGSDKAAPDEDRRGRWGGDGPRPDRAEMRAMRDERRKQALATFDADKNGELSDEERQVMHEARIAEMVSRIDRNADGRLTREELDASAASRRRPPPDFDSIDTNKDGFVTVEELAAARPPRQFRDSGDEEPSGPGTGPR
jgi:hypothetical protein